MKVKLTHDFNYVDYDSEEGNSYVTFYKNIPYEVVHTFEHFRFGVFDHTVYVIINEDGETMSVSKEVVIREDSNEN